MQSTLSSVLTWWSSYYGDHNTASVGITFLHLAGLLVGGGAAVTADRRVLHAWRRDAATRAACLAEVGRVHQIVMIGLGVTLISGVLMTLADLHSFLGSRVFWVKMAFTAVLLLNGAFVMRGERLAARTGGRRGWPILAGAAVSSVTLWLAVVWLGTWLRTAA